MWFPSVSLWWSLDRCPLAPLVNYGCGPGGRLIPALMCTDRWAKEEVNKPFHPSSGCTLRRRMPLCALIIHSNRTVSHNRRQPIHFSRPWSISMCWNSINTNPRPAPPDKWNSQDNKTVSAHEREKYPTYQKLSNSVLGKKRTSFLALWKDFLRAWHS